MDADKAELAERYDAAAAGYAEHWAPALHVLAERFVAQLALPQQGRVLDVGAGTGRLSAFVEGRTRAQVISVDQSLGMLRQAPAGARTAVMDAEQLGVVGASFDAVLAMFMLFHLPHPDAGLREMRRVSHPGALLALTTWGADDPDFRGFAIWDDVLASHGAMEPGSLFGRRELMDTPEKCRELVGAAAYDVVTSYAEPMAHQWTVDQLLGYRTQVGYAKLRWSSLDAAAQRSALAEGRERLSALSRDELTLRDEVIYTVARAT